MADELHCKQQKYLSLVVHFHLASIIKTIFRTEVVPDNAKGGAVQMMQHDPQVQYEYMIACPCRYVVSLCKCD